MPQHPKLNPPVRLREKPPAENARPFELHNATAQPSSTAAPPQRPWPEGFILKVSSERGPANDDVLEKAAPDKPRRPSKSTSSNLAALPAPELAHPASGRFSPLLYMRVQQLIAHICPQDRASSSPTLLDA